MALPLAGRALDELAAAALAPQWAFTDAGWWGRICPRAPFRRANSVLPPAGVSDSRGSGLEAVIDRLETRYRDAGLATRIVISEADPTSEALDAVLADRGYVSEAPVTVMALAGTTLAAPEPTRTVPGATPAGTVRTEVVAPLDATWASGASEAADDDRGAGRAWGHHQLFATTDAPAAFGVIATRGGAPVGSGVGVLGTGPAGRLWCGVLGMATSEGHRRRGVARAILSAIAWGAGARGASGCWLQVEDTSVAAPMYRAAGFLTSHRTHYRTLFATATATDDGPSPKWAEIWW